VVKYNTNRMENKMEENTVSQSVISKEMKITGTIDSSGSLRFDGKLDGELNCSGNVTIGKDADVKGNLNASSVIIGGTVNGNVTAKDKIEMKASARVTGDIKSKRLSVEDGVTFVGKSEVNPSAENIAPKPKSESATEAPVQKPAVAGEPERGKQKDQYFGKKQQ